MQRLLGDAKSEEAYRSKQQKLEQKLEQSVGECKRLKLENDSLVRAQTSFTERLTLNCDNVLQPQAQIVTETESENLELKAKIRALEEKLTQSREVAMTSEQKIDGLRAEVQLLSETAKRSGDPQSPPATRKRLRPCKVVENAQAKRTTNCRLAKPSEWKLGG